MGAALDLPDDVEALKRLVIELRSQLERLKSEHARGPSVPQESRSEQLELTLEKALTARLAPRERPSPAMLAHILVAKYVNHVPLYRQSRLFARAGTRLDRSTLSSWVAGAHAVLEPLIETLNRYVLAGSYLHVAEMPYPVRAPGSGKARMGRLWAYVRDERAWGSTHPAVVMFRFTADRKARHPRVHLAGFAGVLHTSGSRAFDRVFAGDRVVEAASWSQVRKLFLDIHEAEPSHTAAEALRRVDVLHQIECEIRGRSPEERRAIREARSAALLREFCAWLQERTRELPPRSLLGTAVRAAADRWQALSRFVDDGHIDADNDIAERALQGIALRRRTHLFAGADSNGERAAGMYSLIVSAVLNGLDPQTYLRDALGRIADQPLSRLDELLPGVI